MDHYFKTYLQFKEFFILQKEKIQQNHIKYGTLIVKCNLLLKIFWNLNIDMYTLPYLKWITNKDLGFPGGASGKEPSSRGRRPKRCGFDHWVRKVPWSRKHNLPQYSCQENSMDARAYGAAKSWTRLSDWTHNTTRTYCVAKAAATDRNGQPARVSRVAQGPLLNVT